MKITLMTLSFLFSIAASAKIEMVGHDWRYGESNAETIQKVGLKSDETGLVRVVLNMQGSKQVIFTAEHLQMGLSLISFQGKCIKVIPTKKPEAASFILACED